MRFANLAYLLGRKSLLAPTTLHKTSEHGPIAKTRGDLFRTLHIAMREAPSNEVLS